MSINTAEYSTTDLGLAAALLSLDYKLIRLDKDNPRRVVFVFCNDNGMSVVIEDYWRSELKVSALAYFDSQKRLKARLYQ